MAEIKRKEEFIQARTQRMARNGGPPVRSWEANARRGRSETNSEIEATCIKIIIIKRRTEEEFEQLFCSY